MTNVRARYDGRAYATSSHIEILEETEVKLSAFSIFEFPIYTLLAPQILHKPLFLNAPGSIAFSQEHFKLCKIWGADRGYYGEFENSQYWWFSRYVIAAMLVDGKQKIAH